MVPKVEIDDIQAIILTGYAHLNEAVYIFLNIRNGARARQWLASILPEVASARAWPTDAQGRVIKPETRINVAFTHAGLQAMGLSPAMLASFCAEFQEGISNPVRSRLLGDVGASAPENWEMGGPATEPIHVMVMLFAATPQLVEDLEARYLAHMHEMDCVRIVHEETASRLPGMREHFGFRDGISQPGLLGTTVPTPGQELIMPGEFVFGYQNEYGLLPPMPEPQVLGQNGSYLIYRKLEQDVAAFHRFLDEQAGGDAQMRDWLGAKLVGRWPSGAPLALAPERDDPELGADSRRNNCFDYAAEDPYGYHTPLGSHVRRSNPRSGLGQDPHLSSLSSRRHRIIRRGRPYGPPYSPETADTPRGILFIAMNTDIRRQFEFVQQVWLNDPKFAGLRTDKDPFATNHEGDNTLTIQRHPLRRVMRDIPRLVTVRAGGYFFVPGLRALRFIADGPYS